MWLKNQCAIAITRVARGFIARFGAKREKLRLEREEQKRFSEECHAVDVAADVAKMEMLEHLAAGRGAEEVAAGAVLLQNRSRALAAGRRVENWEGQLRDLFKLFDVEQRGALDEDQLALLLKVRRRRCVSPPPPPPPSPSPSPPLPRAALTPSLCCAVAVAWLSFVATLRRRCVCP
jgi:hypothetical protein